MLEHVAYFTALIVAGLLAVFVANYINDKERG
jgi:hypothetical protein